MVRGRPHWVEIKIYSPKAIPQINLPTSFFALFVYRVTTYLYSPFAGIYVQDIKEGSRQSLQLVLYAMHGFHIASASQSSMTIMMIWTCFSMGIPYRIA